MNDKTTNTSPSTTKVLETLTPEQEAMLPEIRDAWIKIGLSCEPLDLPRATNAVHMAYEAGGLAPPKHIFVADSPLSCSFMSYVLDKHPEMLKEMTQAELDKAVQQLKDKDLPSLIKASKDYISHQIYGSHDAGWLSFYDAFKTFGLEEIIKPLNGLIELAKCCGWWAPYEEVAILQHRHTEVHLDDRGLLHNDTGPAVLYRDGFSVYSIHGVRVPKNVVEDPSSITVDSVAAESNIEVRRVMIEKMGVDKYLKDCGAKLVDMDQRTSIGGGPRALLESNDGQKWLVGTDGSTHRTYFMNVPAESTTCSDAHNRISGVDESLIVMEG